MKNRKSAYLISYEYIRDQILNGELPRGTKLVEEKLANELGVSRTPIRESIRKLEEEGLIQKKRVINPTEKDLRNTFGVRILLECYSARCAATYMNEAKLNELYECIVIAKKGTNSEIMTMNKRFHDLIVNASNNPVLIDTIDRMQSVIFLFRKTVVYQKRPNLIEEHEEIFYAIRTHDADKAEQLMNDHLKADLEFTLHI